MRRIERIPIIINFFKTNKIKILRDFIGQKEVAPIVENWDEIEKEWNNHPDYRMGQLLINMGLISAGKTWLEEEVDWLTEYNYFKFEELHFWGRNYDKDMNQLPRTEFIPLKDLTTDHIKAIIKFIKEQGQQLSSEYLEYFKKRINHEKI